MVRTTRSRTQPTESPTALDIASNDNNPAYATEDSFTELITCRIDPELMRLIEEQVALVHPYYRTKSDFVRDALYKWSKYLHENYLGKNTPVDQLALKIQFLSDQAHESEQRRVFATTMTKVNDNLKAILADAATPKLAEETAKVAEKIDDLGDDYWKARAIREFCEMPIFPHVLNALEADSRYNQSALVRLLRVWRNSRQVLRRE